VTPNEAVVKTQETQTLYASTAFAGRHRSGGF